MLRRHSWPWLLAIAIAILAAAFAPASAQAAPQDCTVLTSTAPPGCVNADGTAGPRYEGWVYLNLNHCPAGRMCAAIYQQSTLAWRWNGRSWQRSALPQGWVYVAPYTGEWRWGWTQRTGWLAISGGRFEFR